MSDFNRTDAEGIGSALLLPWAILPDALDLLVKRIAAVDRSLNADSTGAMPSALRFGDDDLPGAVSGDVGVLPMRGIITPRTTLMGWLFGPGFGCALDKWTLGFAQLAANPKVKAIVIEVDSPGGSVAGVEECVQTIAHIRASVPEKPVVAVSSYMCASAAYYIASQADEIVVSPSSQTGSIGVITIHESIARLLDAEGVDIAVITAGKYKGEGNFYEPLSEEGEAAIQALINDYYDQFVAAVASGRKVSKSVVTGGYGEGRVLTARKALAAGMADSEGSLSETVMRLQATRARNKVLGTTGRRAELPSVEAIAAAAGAAIRSYRA